MNFSLSDEQEMLRDAAALAISRTGTVAAARAALDRVPLPDLWPTAQEAGWCGLLISEHHGGAGLGLFEAMLVLEQCGRRLATAGLLAHLPATFLLVAAAEAGDAQAASILPELASGQARAAMVWQRESRFQPEVPGANWLVIRDGNDRAVLVNGSSEALSVEPLTRCDGSRPLAHVQLEAGAGHPLPLHANELDEAWNLTQALLAADGLGVIEASLQMAVSHACERQAFGRPIGSYQAVKHQIVEILRASGTTRSLCFYAGYAAESRPEEFALAASAARFAAEEGADYATRTCIAVLGGIGATWEHDAHLYWRRGQLSRLLLGGASGAADRVAEEIITRATTITNQELK